MAQRQLKAAIIGLGNIGFKFSLAGNKFHTTHFEAYLANSDAQLVAVAETDEATRSEFRKRFAGSIHGDYREMLNKEQPEVVSICTPDATHFQILKDAAAAPSVRAIWCEKPLAISLRDAKNMVALCKKRGIKLAVNFVRRYDDFYGYVKSHLRELLGEIQAVNFYYSGGIVTTGSHMLDLLTLLFGKCGEVSAVSYGTGLWGRLKFGEVPVTIMPMNTRYYSIFEMNILGAKGRLDTINKPFGEYDYRYYVREEARIVPAKFVACKMGDPIPRDLPRRYMDKALEDIVRILREGGSPISSGESALQSLEIMHALIYSAEHGGKTVKLPLRGRVKNLPQSGGDVHRAVSRKP